MIGTEILRDHGIGLGKYKINRKIPYTSLDNLARRPILNTQNIGGLNQGIYVTAIDRDSNDNVYVGCDGSSSYDKQWLHKFDKHLNELWKVEKFTILTLAVSPLNELYVSAILPSSSTTTFQFAKVNTTNGAVIWSKNHEASPIAFDTEGNIYVGYRDSLNNKVLKYSPSGDLLWEKALWKNTIGTLVTSIAVIGTWVLVLGDKLYNMNTNDGAFTSSPHPGVFKWKTDGRYLYGLKGRTLVKFTSYLSQLWEVTPPSMYGNLARDLAISMEGNIYVRYSGDTAVDSAYIKVNESGTIMEKDTIFTSMSGTGAIAVSTTDDIYLDGRLTYGAYAMKLPSSFTITK
ncbi:hypothetical protein [Brevibacillus laterosporus]|uniref:Uncharacterized protein n=1 Tax=Brevibacillus laterosporus TaxID=1465 RepID=A0AAP3DKZ3_BRELA|nr:hypothetical protein [Brevibacillus laterosporus]MCR8982585.1 hypothetical protein [Brevibacillus laterosporus]MCZ0809741.1 hypothetical protein [Brevibacillus laterosporus]MCZ0828335.1 hypothetical protein [Brevibacillus laterosporus]MCZ0851401.1 hypothetical protein [Brevibacillus laterosporus]